MEEARRGGSNPIGGRDEDTTRSMFCNDKDEEQTRYVLDRTGTEAAVVLAEPVSRAGIPADLPKTFVKLLRDQSLPPVGSSGPFFSTLMPSSRRTKLVVQEHRRT